VDGNTADRDRQSKSAGRITTMLEGSAESGYNHGRYAMVLYRGFALDPAYVDGFGEEALSDPEMRRHVLEVLKGEVKIRARRPD
jgi:hypothetical protein